MSTGGVGGGATTAGTQKYRERHAGAVAADYFRRVPAAGGLWLSSLGIGTYLGEADERDDAAYTESVAEAVRSGINVIDTAVNYRFQRSERNIGEALRTLMAEGFTREELVIATKGGFIPFDGGYPSSASAWFRTALLEPGIADPDDVVANCHVMTPRYLAAQIDWSRRNLGLARLDIYYVHNPETQLQEVERAEFLMRIRAAFELLERKVQEGVLGIYGVATWDGFRVPPENPGHLSLKELLGAAEQVAGPEHHFRAIQLPVNLIMTEACLLPTQVSGGRRASLLEAAEAAGMVVMSSGSLLQGRIIGAIGDDFAKMLPGTTSNAQRGLQVVRSVPGIATALVGMKQTAHVKDNLGLARLPALAGHEAMRILKASGRR